MFHHADIAVRRFVRTASVRSIKLLTSDSIRAFANNFPWKNDNNRYRPDNTEPVGQAYARHIVHSAIRHRRRRVGANDADRWRGLARRTAPALSVAHLGRAVSSSLPRRGARRYRLMAWRPGAGARFQRQDRRCLGRTTRSARADLGLPVPAADAIAGHSSVRLAEVQRYLRGQVPNPIRALSLLKHAVRAERGIAAQYLLALPPGESGAPHARTSIRDAAPLQISSADKLRSQFAESGISA